MIQHVWSVLCSKSSIDKETNNISLFEVIEQLQGEGWMGEPVLVPYPLELVSLWARAEPNRPSRGEARVILHSPSGTTKISATQQVDLSEFRRLRHRIKIPGLRVNGPGFYTFLVEVRQEEQEHWEPVARIPLEIQIKMAAPPESEPQNQLPAEPRTPK